MIINNLDTTYITKHEFKKQQSTQYQLREFVHARIVVQHLESYVGKTIDGIVLFYVAKGQGTVYANGEHIGLKENDMIIINLDQSFYISSNDWEFIYFHLTIPKTINLFGNLDWKYSIKDPQNMQGIFYKLLNVSLQQNPFMINSFANLIFGELYHSKVNTYSEISHQDPLKKAVRYIKPVGK